MRYFFTADEHYGHKNIIKYCNRPFYSVEEMNAAMIEKHNSIVKSEDIIFHLGDFCLKGTRYASEIISQLNGSHIFIMGSHDSWLKDAPYIIERKFEGVYIVLCHYAMKTWPRSHHGSWQLFGHSHGTLKTGLSPRQFDVGVDCWDFEPLSLVRIRKIIDFREKSSISVDSYQ